jgi:hypothetical protein
MLLRGRVLFRRGLIEFVNFVCRSGEFGNALTVEAMDDDTLRLLFSRTIAS